MRVYLEARRVCPKGHDYATGLLNFILDFRARVDF